MEPIKFEDHMKHQLEQRKLNPEEQAWNDLEEKIDAHLAKDRHKKYWWLGIAASVVGVLFVISVWNGSDKGRSMEIQIVDTPAFENEGGNLLPEGAQPNSLTKNNVSPEDNMNPGNNSGDMGGKSSETNQNLQEQHNQLLVEPAIETLAQQENRINKQTFPDDKTILEVAAFEERKVQEVVAAIVALRKGNPQVTDAEIDALLDLAEKEIALQRIYDESSNKVDANALLEDVESDLEQSFRDRIFKALKEGYKDVKTAVAKRND